MLLPLLTSALVGYLIGALPFGYLVARSKGINIFEHGSKNPGATNVRRVLGKGPGNLVFFLDALKGVVATGWPFLLPWTKSTVVTIGPAEHAFYSGSLALLLGLVGLFAALVGHCFSCFTGFRGGKGVATTVGGVLVLMPIVVAIAAAVWAILFYSLRYVSLASILAAVSLPISAFLLKQPLAVCVFATLVALFVIVRHRSNIVRLVQGTENRFTRK